ncbi:hypothetical protein GGD50_002708 [Rhizobium paranaense]|uniref:Uncharacterized protein n=1 Tax=Rhizobium paranaense TaxID=1650438 RepID=A0A7W9D1P6_9HYPH|nr:hypothetical protein [Rhizobium paranaense]
MPRDIHRFIPAFETLRFVATSCIGRTIRQTGAILRSTLS